MDEHIERRPSWSHWAPWAIASLVMIIVAMLAYGAGRGEAIADGAPVEHWHWGFGGIFGIFLFVWLLSFFRSMFFGWGFGRGCGPRPWRYRQYYRYHPDDDDYDEWREWHRREHERADRKAV